MDGCRDEAVDQFEPIVYRDGGWLSSESRCMEGPVEKLTGAVSCEHSTRAIRTMSAGREADDEDSGIDLAKGWNWLAPVLPVLVRLALCRCYSCTVIPQPGALGAGDDFRLKRIHFPLEVVGHEGND